MGGAGAATVIRPGWKGTLVLYCLGMVLVVPYGSCVEGGGGPRTERSPDDDNITRVGSMRCTLHPAPAPAPPATTPALVSAPQKFLGPVTTLLCVLCVQVSVELPQISTRTRLPTLAMGHINLSCFFLQHCSLQVLTKPNPATTSL